ncbi:hypothetical protein ABZX75_00990 [Streptomyces sp. NPDC003038]|uniref:SCO2400 family protein n=1 Tax=unclassified Streptomyces TaxID=2593676 RepID=UPI0033A2BCA3
MNYCHACRRHLNGALACAGCGTPAEYLIPVAPAAGSAAGPGAQPGSAPQPAAQPAALAEVFADSLVVLSAPNQSGGRAASRRRAATHRGPRRTVMTIGLGLLLAAGGSLAMARIVTDGERTDRATTVVLTDDAEQDRAVPAPDASKTGAPSGKASGKGSATAKATGGATKSAGPAASSGAATEPAPSESASASATAGPTPGPSGTQGTVKPTASATQPTPGGSGTAKPPASPTPSPTPTPTPTKPSCWWIFC